MKINEIIRTRRKQEKLTQEMVAQYLGVSIPAISKWENGSSYPDITILPALARLLKVDLNTLLSFDEDLTDLEVGNFANEVVKVMQEEGYARGVTMAMDKILEFPTCDPLIYTLACILDGALSMYPVEDKENYEEKILNLYERVVSSERLEIRNQATCMLVHKYTNRGEIVKAQELLDTLIVSNVDKQQIQSNIFVKQGRLKEAAKLLEEKVLSAANEINTALLGMIDISLKEKEEKAAEYYANLVKKTVSLYDLWEFSGYVGQFQVSVAKQDGTRSLELLHEMLKAMLTEWELQKSPLYQHLKGKTGESAFGKQMLGLVLMGLESEKELEFLQGNSEFVKLLDDYRKYL